MGGQYINHFNAVRLRVQGSGTLELRLISLSDVESVSLTDITMSSATNRYPTALANFTQQKAQLEGKTTGIDEIFQIDEILIFTKPIFAAFPQ